MVYKSDALILRTYKLGEADRIVVFLTRDRGKKRGVAKGARRPKSRYTGALEPLTRGEVAYFEREQRELVQLNYVDVMRSPLLAQAAQERLARLGYDNVRVHVSDGTLGWPEAAPMMLTGCCRRSRARSREVTM